MHKSQYSQIRGISCRFQKLRHHLFVTRMILTFCSSHKKRYILSLFTIIVLLWYLLVTIFTTVNVKRATIHNWHFFITDFQASVLCCGSLSLDIILDCSEQFQWISNKEKIMKECISIPLKYKTFQKSWEVSFYDYRSYYHLYLDEMNFAGYR